MKKPIFIKNTVILTAASLILRLLGVVFKVRVAARVGGEGMGAYQLIISVYWLFCAFSQTGVSVAVTRLCADCMSLCRDFRPVMKRAFAITAVTAAGITAAMLLFAPMLSGVTVGDRRFAVCFRLLAASVPAVGFSACLRGYFFAAKRPYVSAASQIIEQLFRIALSFYLVTRFAAAGTKAACAALAAGNAAAETVSAAILAVCYRRRVKKESAGGGFRCGYRAILRISFPLTSGRYIGMALRTAENLLVPRGLVQSGLTKGGALEFFGNIKALVLPVLLFPSSLLGAVSSLLVPEISACAAKGRFLIVKEITEKIIKATCAVSVIFACVFAFCGNSIGLLLYNSQSAGALLVALSPLVPMMYADTVCDGLLKGLDCQRFSFYVGVSDGALRLAAVLVFLPRYGAVAFIYVMYFSNIYTAALNIGMLIKKSRGRIDAINAVFLPLCFALIITKAVSLLLPLAGIKSAAVYVAAFTAVSACLYLVCLFAFGCVKAGEIKELFAA